MPDIDEEVPVQGPDRGFGALHLQDRTGLQYRTDFRTILK
jgi:hypothetical protein